MPSPSASYFEYEYGLSYSGASPSSEFFAGFAHDAVLLAAAALKRSRLSSSLPSSSSFMSSLRSVVVTGCSGTVSILPGFNDARYPTFSIINVQGIESVVVASLQTQTSNRNATASSSDTSTSSSSSSSSTDIAASYTGLSGGNLYITGVPRAVILWPPGTRLLAPSIQLYSIGVLVPNRPDSIDERYFEGVMYALMLTRQQQLLTNGNALQPIIVRDKCDSASGEQAAKSLLQQVTHARI